MHRLNRNSVPIPVCLVPTGQPRRYNDLRGPEKTQVRTALLAMQDERCAYCERRTGQANNDGHIEHFRNQAAHTHLETDWNNLFWSCTDENSCGKHKDNCCHVGGTGRCRAFNVDHLINPCVDNPDDFMQFVSDGTIHPRDGLGGDQIHRYEETLRVFNLADSPFLRRSREDAVKPYISALSALQAAGSELFQRYVSGELAQLDSTPFATAIRHFLESNLR